MLNIVKIFCESIYLNTITDIKYTNAQVLVNKKQQLKYNKNLVSRN